jgi:diguanylate cyclase
VITLDIDGLTHVNDTQGHAVGDALLKRCANLLRENVRGEDVCARLGGDEFAVLIRTRRAGRADPRGAA